MDRPTAAGAHVPVAGRAHRLLWVDLIKVVCALLVVNFHLVLSMRDVTSGVVVDAWFAFSEVLEPVRMPMFFAVSGLLAASAVRRSWGQNRRLLVTLGYLFVLWTVIQIAVNVATTADLPSEDKPLITAFGIMLFPQDGYWYLLALMCFFVVGKLTRRWPAWLVLCLAAIPAILRPESIELASGAVATLHEPGMVVMMPVNLVYYLIGLRLREWILVAAARTPAVLAAALAAAALVLGALRAQDPLLLSDVFFFIALLWVVPVAAIARRWCEEPGAGRLVAGYLGPRTLPIFLLQFPLLQILRIWLGSFPPDAIHTVWGQLLYPIVGTAVAAALALLAYRVASRGRCRYLFTAPEWAVRSAAVRPS